jgi:hypothetical protein
MAAPQMIVEASRWFKMRLVFILVPLATASAVKSRIVSTGKKPAFRHLFRVSNEMRAISCLRETALFCGA